MPKHKLDRRVEPLLDNLLDLIKVNDIPLIFCQLEDLEVGNWSGYHRPEFRELHLIVIVNGVVQAKVSKGLDAPYLVKYLAPDEARVDTKISQGILVPVLEEFPQRSGEGPTHIVVVEVWVVAIRFPIVFLV